MSENNSANEDLTRYLLGEMSEAEQMELEVRYFGNPEMFAELCAWRDNLIDAYVGGQLSPALRIRFEAAIEQSWFMNERIRFAETLQDAVKTRGTTSQPQSKWGRLRASVADRRKLLFDAVLLLIILAATWLILRFFF